VIADRGFPYWPEIETVDLSLVDDIPRVLDVLHAIRRNFAVGRFFMAEEFRLHNTPVVIHQFAEAMAGAEVDYKPHAEFRKRVPHAIGLIRTGDTTHFANVILESA
jgi:D-ribose pyranase